MLEGFVFSLQLPHSPKSVSPKIRKPLESISPLSGNVWHSPKPIRTQEGKGEFLCLNVVPCLEPACREGGLLLLLLLLSIIVIIQLYLMKCSTSHICLSPLSVCELLCESRNLVCKLLTNLAMESGDCGTRDQSKKKKSKRKTNENWWMEVGVREEWVRGEKKTARSKVLQGMEKRKIENGMYKDLWAGEQRKKQESEM